MIALRLTMSYVGTRFAGWQRQRRGETVQGHLEAGLETVLGQAVSFVGAGRTDAGVHARAQVAHVHVPAEAPVGDLRRALNALIPQDIRVERLTRTRADFHARHDASGKWYRYRLAAVRKPSPFVLPFVGRLTGGVPDVEMMRRAAARLTGRRDYSCFCGAGSAIRDGRRRVERLAVTRRGEEFIFDVEGDGFLRHQVRNMVGTLVECGQGKRKPVAMSALLASRDRRRAGPTAPASGLCLMAVRYGRGRNARERA